MEPNLYHLRYFIDAASLGGVAPAARKNNVSQSAVSQAIRRLEESLNCELLEHSRNQFKLTPEGRLAAESIQGILNSIADLKIKLAGAKMEVGGSLSISTLRSLALVLFPQVMRNLKSDHPSIDPTLMIGHTKNILTQVINDEIEVGVVVDNRAINGVNKYILHEGRFRCVVGAAHKDRIKSLGFLATEEKPGVAEIKKAFRVRYGKTAPIEMIVESWEVIARFASEGLGIGLIPDFVAASVPHLQLSEVYSDLAADIRYRIVIITKSSMSSNARALAQELEKSKTSLLSGLALL